MGLFSFLFRRESKDTYREPHVSGRPADKSEEVSDATMFIPRVDDSAAQHSIPSTGHAAPSDDASDILLDEISSAVQDKLNEAADHTEAVSAPMEPDEETKIFQPVTEATLYASEKAEKAEEPTEISAEDTSETLFVKPVELTSESEEAPAAQDPVILAADTKPEEIVISAPEEDSSKPEGTADMPAADTTSGETVTSAPAEDSAEPEDTGDVSAVDAVSEENTSEPEIADPVWGSHFEEQTAKRRVFKPSMPSFDDECFRLVWKLKGTNKKRRLKVISECTKGQPVFIICDSNGKNCIVITEDGEEIGKLSDQDTTVYHNMVAGTPHNMYIQKISAKEFEKIGVKILVIVRKKIPEVLH